MRVLHLRTGCRLHFGLMELAAEEPLRYAGLGMMLDEPGFELSFARPHSDASYSTAGRAPCDFTASGCNTTHFASVNTFGNSPGNSPSSMASGVTSGMTSLRGPTSVDASQVELARVLSRGERAKLTLEYQRRMSTVVQQHPVFEQATNAAQAAECQIRLIKALPMHSGLGAGTQLACAVAAGLELFVRGGQAEGFPEDWPSDHGTTEHAPASQAQHWRSAFTAQPLNSTQWLTKAAGRGLRSAIGLFGFLHGGLILDRGYPASLAQETHLSPGLCAGGRPLACQSTPVASQWRVVLIVPQNRQEVSGAQETQWMAELESLPNPHRNDMLSLAEEAMSLASKPHSFNDFTHCLDQYMELAGQLFSRFQGGLYNGPDVAAAVQCARRIGLRGVGQSSWGPTVFGFVESQALAQAYAASLSELRSDWCVRVARPASHAAEYRWQ